MVWKAVLVLILLAGPAGARPWPRGAGESFLSFSATLETGAGHPGASLYLERGLSARTTLILSASRSRGGAPRAVVLLSRNLWPGRDWRFGWSLGAGVRDGDAAARAELSAGRGLRLLGQFGWLMAEARAVATPAQIDAEIAATLGLTLAQGTKIYSELFASAPLLSLTGSAPSGRAELRAALSAAVPVARDTWLDIGLSLPLAGGGATRLKLGVWREF